MIRHNPIDNTHLVMSEEDRTTLALRSLKFQCPMAHVKYPPPPPKHLLGGPFKEGTSLLCKLRYYVMSFTSYALSLSLN